MVKVKAWYSSLCRTVSPSFVFSSFQQHFLFSVSICAFPRVNPEMFIFQNRGLKVLHEDQFFLKCMNVICIMFILTCLTNHQFFSLLKESRGSEVFSFFVGFVFLGLNCFIIPNYMMSYLENKRHSEK